MPAEAIPLVSGNQLDPRIFNPDGTLVRPSGNPMKAPAYRAAQRAALAAQDFLPGYMNSVTNAQISNAPRLAESQLALMQQYGPQIASAESAINAASQKAQAQTDADLLGTTGRDITSKTLDLQKLADPEFFGLREAIGGKAGELIAGQDPNKLTEAELANVERAGNRSNIGRGLENSGSNTAAIGNAMMFGDRLTAKRNNLLNTLTSIGNLAPNLKSGAFNYGAATGRGPSSANDTIENSFASAGSQAGQFGSQLGGLSGGLSSQISAQHQIGGQNQTAPWEKVTGSLPDY